MLARRAKYAYFWLKLCPSSRDLWRVAGVGFVAVILSPVFGSVEEVVRVIGWTVVGCAAAFGYLFRTSPTLRLGAASATALLAAFVALDPSNDWQGDVTGYAMLAVIAFGVPQALFDRHLLAQYRKTTRPSAPAAG